MAQPKGAIRTNGTASRTYHARPDVEPLRAGRPGRAQVPDPKSRVSISLVHQPRGTTGTQRPGEWWPTPPKSAYVIWKLMAGNNPYGFDIR
uniref:hypothetical protein n=1 Tax=Helicanthes elasticus TaxID=2486982 RepID=UPI0023D7FBE5|nr:hypothetical protein P2Y95_mgp05 [Helicanthes elasticus]WCQ87315.1 hypothetical protein Heeli_054 [Helicanthes elasticus]